MAHTEHKKLLLTNILAASPVLGKFVEKIREINTLNQAISKKLEPSLAQHCRVANLREGILILNTPSSAWGHQLRFAEPDLLSALRAEPKWCHLKSIKSYIQPTAPIYETFTPKTNQPNLRKPAPSKIGASLLNSIAVEIKSEKLKHALVRLSKKL